MRLIIRSIVTASILWVLPPVLADGPPADRPPTVAITAPAADSTIFGSLLVKADAADDVGVAGVQFFLDGQILGAEDTTAPYSVAWSAWAEPNGSHTLTAEARDTQGQLAMSDPITVTVINDNSPSQIGEWSPKMTWPLVAVHMALLYTRKILMWDGMEGGDPDLFPRVWDPVTNLFTSVPNDSGLFCAAQNLLADGRVFTAGGHLHGNGGSGIDAINIFNPATSTWSRPPKMRFPRWYPSNLQLPDGRVVTFSGWIDDGIPDNWADVPEIFNPATNSWNILRSLDTSDMHTKDYLFPYLLPNGKAYIYNPEDGRTRIFNLSPLEWTDAGTLPVKHVSTALYRPGKVILSGGGDLAVSQSSQAATMLVDATQVPPVSRTIAPMNYARYQHNLVVLADGSVLAVGGSVMLEKRGPEGVLTAEIWDLSTEAWTPAASMIDPRMYHSTALLLPDGRVLSAGGGQLDVAIDYTSAQIFSPPYLFRGPRPVISQAPATLAYNQSFAITTPDAAAIRSVALVPLGSVTHTLNMNQNYVELPFTAVEGQLTVQGPASDTLAVPGYYMLFIINQQGVPSIAPTVHLLVITQPPAAVQEAYYESNGQVVMEAEHYDSKITRSSKDWVVEAIGPGFSRSAYVTGLPNTAIKFHSNYLTASPELKFNVQITTPGLYYVWVRGKGASYEDDSVHLGLDGLGPSSADRISPFYDPNQLDTWIWRNTTMDGVPPTIFIGTAGFHTIHLWMREDGVKVDKILLRTDASSTEPAGLGPAESPRGPVFAVGDTTQPVISSVAASNITMTSATVTWVTDEVSSSQVEYGLTTTYDSLSPLNSPAVQNHAIILSSLQSGATYHYRMRSTDPSNNEAVSGDFTFVTIPASGAPPFLESNGQVVMEAEHFHSNIARGQKEWLLATGISGFSSNGYMQSLLNGNSSNNTGYVTTSPELVFYVQFANSGTYYVWVRGSAASGNDDTLHAGIDGTGSASADRIGGGFPAAWTWKRDTMDGVPATVIIPSAGLHTVHLWMREDGMRVDKILLRKSSSSTAPAGAGPPESVSLPKIMPVGDSITLGFGDPNLFGYRDHLLSLLGLGAYALVGTYQSPVSDPVFDVDHEGVGANRTDQVKARIAAALSVQMPKPNPPGSRILLHIGTNDMKQLISVSTAVGNVTNTINIINNYDPSIAIHVALIIPSQTASVDSVITNYNSALAAQLAAMQASKSNLYTVDMNAAFKQDPNWSADYFVDNFHPNDVGYQVMAEEWKKSVQSHQ